MRLETARSVQLAQQALACLPHEHVFTRSVLTLSLGIAYSIHDAQAASKALGEALRLADNPHMAVMSMCQSAYQLYLQGQLHQAFELYQHALECTPQGTRIPAMSVALLGCGEIQREWHRLEEAERLLIEALPPGREWTFLGVSTGIVATLALVKQARGDVEQARKLLQDQLQLAAQAQDTPSLQTLHAYLAQLDLDEGRQDEAARWAEDFARELAGQALNALHERAYLVLARVWIAQERYAEAATLLTQLLAMAESTGRQLSVLKILVLQALLLQRINQVQALETLARALALGEPEGYVRTFVEAGAALIPLLTQLIKKAQQGVTSHVYSPAYAQKLLMELAPVQPPYIPDSVEQLSEREYAIVRLLAAGFSNQQIAQQLVIALSTVKWHLRQIYVKLHVTSRTQLLAYARTQGWL